jgi:hypothetical protein
VQDRMNEKHLKRLSVFFMSTAMLLPPGIPQQLMRVNGIVAYNKYLEIDQWQNLAADRVAVSEVTIDNRTEETCYSEYRFHKRDLRYLFIALRFPERIVLSNKSVMPGEKAFLMMLHRMAYPRRLVDMEEFVGREYSTISRCFNFVVNLMDVEHSHLLLDNLGFFLPRFPDYNRVILDKIAVANENLIPNRERMVTAFLDGTNMARARRVSNMLDIILM